MQQLHEKYRGQGLSIIGVNVDEQHMSAETSVADTSHYRKAEDRFPDAD